MLHFLFLLEIYRDGLPKVHFFHTLVQVSKGVLTHLSQACKNKNNQKLQPSHPISVIMQLFDLPRSSVPHPWHLGVDPDPDKRIHASD